MKTVVIFRSIQATIRRNYVRISLAFAQQKMPVTQMFVNKATLEDIFLELTGGEK